MSRSQVAPKTHRDNGFPARLARAILTYQSQIGSRVNYGELAIAITRAEGREKPWSKSAVSEWVQGRSEPRLATIAATAQVLGVSAGWLAFGEDVNQEGATVLETGARAKVKEPPLEAFLPVRSKHKKRRPA